MGNEKCLWTPTVLIHQSHQPDFPINWNTAKVTQQPSKTKWKLKSPLTTCSGQNHRHLPWTNCTECHTKVHQCRTCVALVLAWHLSDSTSYGEKDPCQHINLLSTYVSSKFLNFSCGVAAVLMDFRSHVAWVAVQTWSVANTYLPELDLDLYLTDVSLFVQVENVMRQLCTVFSSSGVRLARGPILALEVSVFIIHHVTPDSQIPKCTAKSVSIMYFLSHSLHRFLSNSGLAENWKLCKQCRIYEKQPMSELH